VIQPVIDLLTGQFANHLTTNITIGMVYRVFLIVLIFIYLGKHFMQQQLKLFGLFSATLFTVLLTFFGNLFLKESFLFLQEAQFLFKTIYYISVTYITFVLIKQQTLSRQFVFQLTAI